jgi:hypothetical protein
VQIGAAHKKKISVRKLDQRRSLRAAEWRKGRRDAFAPIRAEIGRIIFRRAAIRCRIFSADGKQISFVIDWHDCRMTPTRATGENAVDKSRRQKISAVEIIFNERQRAGVWNKFFGDLQPRGGKFDFASIRQSRNASAKIQ